jgi:hypothetical protein
MRTHAEFASTEFPALPGEEQEMNPGRFGKRLAEFLASKLPTHGFQVTRIGAEDWGWRIDLQNDAFPLWLGCGNYEEIENGFLCFIEPSKPSVRKLFSKIDTTATVEKLASAVEAIVTSGGKAARFRWWADGEVNQ